MAGLPHHRKCKTLGAALVYGYKMMGKNAIPEQEIQARDIQGFRI